MESTNPKLIVNIKGKNKIKAIKDKINPINPLSSANISHIKGLFRMKHLPRVATIASLISLYACYSGYSAVKSESSDIANPVFGTVESGNDTTVFLAALPISTPNRKLLAESWDGYRKNFIQTDGRVVDFQESDRRSTSEGQAYAMLRAVFINDPKTFALTLNWAENNLQRKEGSKYTDNLWAWKWGKNTEGNWGTIDKNFASDADIDAITALILASRRWNRPEYLKLAKIKLKDLWDLSTVTGPQAKRYLLPGPVQAFVPNKSTIYLNPSYLAPYAFRLFAQVDSDRDWLSLIETSYLVLEGSQKISSVNLPSDWVALDITTGKYLALPSGSNLQSLYSFDAYRVWWRVALDAAWFNTPQSHKYLQTSTKYLQQVWQSQSRLPARIDLQGKPLVTYEATSQYAMFYAALRLTEPKLAQSLLVNKLLTQYKQGIWDDQSAYYTQNLAWLGTFPPEVIPRYLLENK
jgi:endoglucanase